MYAKYVLLTVFLLSLAAITGYAQSDQDYVDMIYATSAESDIILQDTTNGWHFEWVGGLNGSQATYRNWSQGGVNTISMTASTLFNLKYRRNQFGYQLVTNFRYGQARIEGEGTRKTDDKIALANKFSYLFKDERFNIFGNINFTTQFDKGYDYNKDPKLLLSRFMAPAYLSQVLGLGFHPAEYFSAEAGLAMKETIVRDTTLSERYGLEPREKFRFEPGYSLIFNFEKKIVSNVRLVSTVETFTNLKESVRKTDINFSNEVVGKINDYLNTSFQFVLVYDEDFSREVQLKQVLSVGFSYSFL
ncbi:DUF3078 domain-containing protein [Aliifodinibius sp. S!AR15-10]|uniref:DUF3078 domain-containing protein n=1 Tax=Aliifodinibius sp. S!AR15-10 TaxID=2950437 RepID=UPI002854FCF0|nr:DUF3078 domain-containing protein [Aliifodinibius sp. S!AR15-10]MDR8393121.1 DUF3078 domain-containing protein [Aliifodinibius sp. S!AR15-10]